MSSTASVTRVDANTARELRAALETASAAQRGERFVVAELPAIGRRLVRGVDYVVRRVGRGYGRIELVEQGPPSVTGCVATLGFIDASLERVGAVEVEVNLLSCRALGDPNCLFEISWLT